MSEYCYFKLLLLQKSPFLDVAGGGGSGTDDEEQHVDHKLFSVVQIS